MISKNIIKQIQSLGLKKYRSREKLFIVEGDKMISELLLAKYPIKQLYITSAFRFEIPMQGNLQQSHIVSLIEPSELKKISQLKTPQNSLAVCQLPAPEETPATFKGSLTFYIDGIQDPGNMGTILRICDWFGIAELYCSEDTVDLFNPKVIQASMGSFSRVAAFTIKPDELKKLAQNSQATVYGTFMNGKNIYIQNPDRKSILVLGNEGVGIRKEIEALIDEKISIPNFSTNQQKAESLNVSMAAAILCSEFKRPR